MFKTNLQRASFVFNGVFPGAVVTEEDFGNGPSLCIDNVTISPGEVDVPWIGGYRKAPGFNVDVAVSPSGDLAEIGSFPSLDEAIREAVKVIAEQQANKFLDYLATEDMAADFAAEQATIEAAKREGIEAFDAGISLQANPYPTGIQHYREWAKGWDFAAGLKVAKAIT